ncbi:hypothetical protein PYCC9005_005431 [Savitreella phatthalungensis]
MLAWMWPILAMSPMAVLASDIISADSFTPCANASAANTPMTVKAFSFRFNRDNSSISFSVTGYSNVTANVTAVIKVSAYGISALEKTLNPCDYDIPKLCPVSQGDFYASGLVTLGADIIKQIPAAAFQVPDLDGQVTLNLLSADTGEQELCLSAPIGNGESAATAAASYSTAGIAAGAVAVSIGASIAASMGAAAAGGGAAGVSGAGTSVISTSPNAGDVLMYFQAVATNGMLSVAYPAIVRSYYQNFAWATGLIPLERVQDAIDDFRKKTGGNLERSSYQGLKNTTLVFTKTSSESAETTQSSSSTFTRRAVDYTDTSNTTVSADTSKVSKYVQGITAFSEQVRIPSENTFMTLFIVFLGVIGGIIALCILFRLLLEAWYRLGKFPKKLSNLRAHYWTNVQGLVVRTILIVYGTWALFCFYQFRNGDSWAAALVAGGSLAVFSLILLFFTVKITLIAWKRSRDEEGGVSKSGIDKLYANDSTRRRYGIFYDQFKAKFWWWFIPCIVYTVIKAGFIVWGEGHGLVQVIGCLALETVFLLFFFFTRAYDGRQANVVNSMIGIVRIVSLVGTLVFVDILAFAETTKTVSGIVIVVLQSLLTVILAILIILNAVLPLFKKKQPEKKAEDEEKDTGDDADELTPLGPCPKHTSGVTSKSLGDRSSFDSDWTLSDSDAHKLGLISKTDPKGFRRSPLGGTTGAPNSSDSPRAALLERTSSQGSSSDSDGIDPTRPHSTPIDLERPKPTLPSYDSAQRLASVDTAYHGNRASRVSSRADIDRDRHEIAHDIFGSRPRS